MSLVFDVELFYLFQFLHFSVSFVLFLVLCVYFFFFFFQAEDGIRDIGVTGVQTCALPILISGALAYLFLYIQALMVNYLVNEYRMMARYNYLPAMAYMIITSLLPQWNRSEERRVGKECRSRCSPDH